MTPRQRRALGIDPRTLRRVNTSVTLRTLAVATEPLSMTAVAEGAGLSRRTVELILDELVAAGWVDELDRVPTTGSAGRPARRFALRADYALLAAARVTTHEASVIVSDVRGQVLGRARAPLADYYDPRSTLDTVAALVAEALAAAGGPTDRLRAGAIASGGAIDEHGVIRRLVNAPRWTGIDLPRELAARVPMTWFADNDANLAALAERWRGAAQGHEDVAWATLGTRSGIGMLIRGAVHRGWQGAAGEIVEASTLPASAFDLHPVGNLTSPIAADRDRALGEVRAARHGDPVALAHVQEFADHIVGILITFSWTLAPSLFVLGGGIEDAGDVLLSRVREALGRANIPDIPVEMTALGADAPLIGALRAVLDRMDVELFGPLVELETTTGPSSGGKKEET